MFSKKRCYINLPHKEIQRKLQTRIRRRIPTGKVTSNSFTIFSSVARHDLPGIILFKVSGGYEDNGATTVVEYTVRPMIVVCIFDTFLLLALGVFLVQAIMSEISYLNVVAPLLFALCLITNDVWQFTECEKRFLEYLTSCSSQ